ncbi:c-type cytochrome [Hymenobacter cheonanensis]|uniref:c-type cytochrome n=1 Tax=Hymenobacter sp. CA2-7 TaxID=3063993 RepID=UPI0027130F5A|nr:cytochrome c [Hymenobacter sp. CA2-7]MDO7884048.1 cytochrome c [Hymenobacter sp. CA2-7]
MRTNPAAFALTFGMGLIILLIGFLALNVGGLVSLAPAEGDVAAQQMPADSSAARPVAVAYVPASAEEAAAIAEGDALFKNNCAQCHAVNDKVVGPALASITKRRTIAWIVSWVHNSSKVIASGDEYAVKLFEDNGKQQMPAFPQLSDKEIKSIMAWVTSQEGNGPSSGVSPSGTVASR